jgi:hypothetical protein
MRLAGLEALHRSASHLVRGTVPTMRELLLDLKIPRAYLLPEADGPLPGTDALTQAGVPVVPIPDCGHNIMPDSPPSLRARHRSGARGPPSAVAGWRPVCGRPGGAFRRNRNSLRSTTSASQHFGTPWKFCVPRA